MPIRPSPNLFEGEEQRTTHATLATLLFAAEFSKMLGIEIKSMW